ncbi:uncharacterized protein LOC128240890 [Mya arenaria]|uniref:uncharacterized protein LOC128240890 n=1 Tax=Mya arenaria TaxID=6604 RepID=UPI0022E19508|nr:uncharacterized protein LOC128240890 [Mya arenaria]
MDVNWSNSESQKSLRTVLKWEIQHLLHRLSETGEETLLLTANTREFHVAGLGSEKGCEFLNSTNVAEIKSKFLSFCTACGDDSDDSFPLKYFQWASCDVATARNTYLKSIKRKRNSIQGSAKRKKLAPQHRLSHQLTGRNHGHGDNAQEITRRKGIPVKCEPQFESEDLNFEQENCLENEESGVENELIYNSFREKFLKLNFPGENSYSDDQGSTHRNATCRSNATCRTNATSICEGECKGLNENDVESFGIVHTSQDMKACSNNDNTAMACSSGESLSLLTNRDEHGISSLSDFMSLIQTSEISDIPKTCQNTKSLISVLKPNLHMKIKLDSSGDSPVGKGYKTPKKKSQKKSKLRKRSKQLSPFKSSRVVKQESELDSNAVHVKQEFDDMDSYTNNNDEMETGTLTSQSNSSVKQSPSKSKHSKSRRPVTPKSLKNFNADIKDEPSSQSYVRPPGKLFKSPAVDEPSHETALLDITKLAVGRYQCPVCYLTTRDRHDLKRHLRTHSKEKPYQCVLCDRKFTRRWDFENHLLQKHGCSDAHAYRSYTKSLPTLSNDESYSKFVAMLLKGIQEGKTGLDLLVENNGKDVSKTTKTESDLYPENDDNEDERHDLSDEESESDNEGNETDNQSTKKQTALTTVPSTFSDENLNSNSADLEPDPSYTEKLQSKDPDEKSCAEDSDTNDNGDSNDTEIGGYLASDHEESPKDVETRNFHGLFDIKQDMNI